MKYITCLVVSLAFAGTALAGPQEERAPEICAQQYEQCLKQCDSEKTLWIFKGEAYDSCATRCEARRADCLARERDAREREEREARARQRVRDIDEETAEARMEAAERERTEAQSEAAREAAEQAREEGEDKDATGKEASGKKKKDKKERGKDDDNGG